MATKTRVPKRVSPAHKKKGDGWSWMLIGLLVIGLAVTLAVYGAARLYQDGRRFAEAEASNRATIEKEHIPAKTHRRKTKQVEVHSSISNHYGGFSTDGTVYKSAADLWKNEQTKMDSWYKTSESFWNAQEASNNGVLLGYESLHDLDIRDSRELLVKTFSWWQPGKLEAEGKSMVALDCAAGVGRVTKNLLLHLFGTVDLLEPAGKLLDKAREDLQGQQLPGVPEGHKVDQFFHMGLQDMKFDQANRYDTIWIQWCLLYLSDDALLRTLVQLQTGLNTNGVVFVKENVSPNGFVVDRKDSSITRTREVLEAFFTQAGLMILDHGPQKDYPEGLYEVYQWSMAKALPSDSWHYQQYLVRRKALGMS